MYWSCVLDQRPSLVRQNNNRPPRIVGTVFTPHQTTARHAAYMFRQPALIPGHLTGKIASTYLTFGRLRKGHQ